MGTFQASDIFHGVQFCIDFAAFSNLSFKRKQQIRGDIVSNGGILSYILTKQTNYLVTSNAERTLTSYKGRTAQKYGIAVVSYEFLAECIKAGQLLDPQPYLLSETKESQSFCSGKITTKSQTHQKKAKAVKFVHPPDIKKLRAWPYKSADAPVFDEKNFEIAKDVLFQGFDSSGSISSFCALELHVIPSQRPCDGFRYRLFSHTGNLKGLEEGDEGIKECRYCNTLGEALGAYTVFYNQQTQAPYNMTKVESVLSHSIGSDKMIQMKISDYCHEEDVILSPDVANLVDVLWNEATGSLSDILAVPVNTIKLEDVEKAEGILLLLKRSFDNVEDASKVKKLSDEFFSIIPHKSETLEIASRQDIAKKQDLCQLIKDMVNISESTNWQARRSVYSKYRSLKCHIECLQHGSDEFQSIQECVNSSESGSFKINILNIFSIRRPVEDATFSREIENKKLLFHSSKVTNFVGILSRGLLLPKIVVDDFGGTRSDAGMLGSGIYFASSASTSAKYSAPGNHGTRLMLVNEVALGSIKAFRKFALDLTSPPYGYNSCHGVQGKEDEPSDFKDDEFVIYNGNQQKIRYLVEFVLPDDKVIPRDDVSLDSGFSDEEMEVDEEESSVDISDVMSIVDPLSKIEAGLKGTGDKVIPLQSVHIRARLLDLAAQVVVFQAYKNSSSTPIEAKYVFPLDDMAAVCGFEAFINDKHIVGEVKEKEQAHKEYREAISQGHGAYLMDEETPDVFTVSVGNLPPGSQVLIKITYVTELLVDGEHICFSLPGSLAPWKRSKALEEITQTDVYSVPIEEEQLRDLKDFSVNVSIEMPFEIRSIDSPTHPIGIKRSATKAVIVVEPGQSMENGFQLLIGLAEIHVPRMWVERHTNKPDSQACMLAFYPEFESESPQVVEVLFLVDVSSSMKGSPIEEAKKILLLCLTHMNRNWIFNIILFGSKNSELFPCSRRKDEAFGEAEKFIKSLKANKGSTELWRVLQKLSLLPAISTADHPRNLFLISDGHVTEEETSLNFIRKNCQCDRLFTFGVGSTANRYLLRFMAKAGAGASEFFDSKAKSKWERKVKSQLSKAEQPSLTSVEIAWQQHDSGSRPPIQAPTHLLSTFSGSRQVVYGFVDNCTQASLTAEVDGKRLSTIVSTTDLNVTTGKILHQLTAKAVIRDWDEGSLHEKRTGHEVEKRNRKEFIITISKEFSVTSKFTSFVAIEHREKNEKFEEGKGPSIQDLLKEEVIDILPYIGWEEKIEDKQKREQTTEEWLEEQLKKAKVLETCAVLRCERLYQDVLNKARDKLGPNHKLYYDAAFSLVNFYLSVMGDKNRASIVFEQTQLLKDSATADYDAFVVCKSMKASEEETRCEEETSSEEEVSRSEEDSFGEDYEKLESVKDGETFEWEETGDEREELCNRMVFRKGPSITRVQADGAEEQVEETIKDDLEKGSLLLQSDDYFGDSDGGSVCFEGPIEEGDSSPQDTQTSPTIFQQEKLLVEGAMSSMSTVESTYESVHEELEMGKGLSRNVLKGVTANLEEEKRSLDFQSESALPLTSNNINVAQSFSCKRTSGLFGVPDLPAPRKKMIPPLPPRRATSSSPPPAYERGAPPPTTELLRGLPLPSGLAKALPTPPPRAFRPPPSSIPTSSLLSEPDAYFMSLRSPARESEVMTLPRDRRRRVEKSVLHLEKPDGVYYRKARLARIPMEKTKEKTIVPPPGVEQDTTDKIRKSAKSFPASQRMLSPHKVELGINDNASREEKDHTRSASEMQYYSISSKRMKLREIFNKQKADGFWDTNDLTIIGANKNDFLDFLGNAGAKSLGLRIFEGVQKLLSTLLVLAFIKFRLSIDVPLSLPLGDTVGKVIFSRLVELYSKRIIQALKWIKEQEKTMPSMYTRLEFGANWEAASEKILQEICA
ncbi:protein mono-ADP-ribosyltransferase PARP4-like isoform X2 [Acropora muricata]|uniref:protein mono-ADP-ribosyltransferase PARP4-like isoform X2 n=1 Tax=Acropora muricata TaxID=159855 RepID=UPI0034E5976A